MSDSTKLAVGVDTVIRLHDPSRFLEFDSALFSLFSQAFRPVHPIVVTQNFDSAATAGVQTLIDAYDWEGRGHYRPSLINVDAPAARDIRSHLLNVGIGLAKMRFLAFLDGDDYLYGHAYEYLVHEALASGAALNFGNIVCKHVRVFDRFVYSSKTLKDTFMGESLADLVNANFCPIHSFIVDRGQVAADDLKFNTQLRRLEDYDFLLRLSAKYSTNFESRKTFIGVYNYHLDGRGSIQFGDTNDAKAAENLRAWNEARRHIWRLKTTLRSDPASPVALSEHSVSE